MASTSEEFVVYQAVLNRMNITWEPDQTTAQNVKNAIEEAQSYLADRSGNPDLQFDGAKRALLITCAQYILYSKLADFAADYQSELETLRLREGFRCGEESTV